MFFNHDDFTIRLVSVINVHTIDDVIHFRKAPFTILSFRIGNDYKIYKGDKVYVAKAGSIAIVPPNTEFERAVGEGRFISARFFSDKLPVKDITVFNPADVQRYQQKFLSLHNVWSHRKSDSNRFKCLSLLYDILSEMELEHNDKAGGKQSLLSSVVDYIHTNFRSSELTVNNLCTSFNVSDTYLRRIFMKSFNMTPISYINNLKVSYAKELLISGEYTISKVAEKCGFNSTSYFCTLFKKETGYSPMYYCKNPVLDN